MADINLEVWDATGNKRLSVQVPDDVEVDRILLVLAEKLHLPKFAPDGQLMSYKFHHRRLGVQLRDDQPLAAQGVKDADVVRIQPEITAGGLEVAAINGGDGRGDGGGGESIREALAKQATQQATQDRYHRQGLIDWWDQKRVSAARVLVVGAGALGNEILKLLALTGVGSTLVYDPDRIERSNLSRSVLFRDDNEGAFKADVVVARMRELNPNVRATAHTANIIASAGLGVFHWADIVIAGVDNREARMFINSACARTGRRWVDGAIEGLSGLVRAFDPARGACYECTMSAVDRKLIAERRSCALLARDVVARGHVPSTAVAASIVGALEVQEAIKLLHGQPALLGEGLHLHGLWSDVSRIAYPRRDDCPGHDTLGEIVPLGLRSDEVTLGALLDRAEARLGEGAVLDLSRDVILRLSCPSCGRIDHGGAVLGSVREREARCPGCGVHRVVEIATSVSRDGRVDLSLTPATLGLPPFDVIVARQGIERQEAWLLDGDAAAVLGDLAPTDGGAGPRAHS